MTESDKLLAKADALLARGRSTVAVPQPPADYPMLTDVVRAPVARGKVAPQKTPDSVQSAPSEPRARATAKGVAASDSLPPSSIVPRNELETKDPSPVTIEPGDAFLIPPPSEPAPRPDDAAMHALEERVYLRVLNTIEPFVGTFIEDPLRLRLEELARRLAAGIAEDARSEIMTLVRDAVRSAVARELETRRDQ